MLTRLLFKKHLEDDEVLVRLVHKHWLLGLQTLFWPTLCIALAACVVVLYPTRGVTMVIGLVEVVLGVWWLRNFFDYYLDAWLVTTHGIVDVAWHGWFHRESTRVLYSDIQGVSYEIKGVVQTLMQVGAVSVEKISNGESITLEFVKKPRRVVATVLKCMEAYLHAKNLKDSKQIQELLATMLTQQMQMQELSPDDED